MQIFIKTSFIPENLGGEFSICGSLTPQNITVLNDIDITSGYILSVSDEETKIIISPINVNVEPFEFIIDLQNQIQFTAENFSNTDFRKLDDNGEIQPFRQEIFPEYKIEEISQANEGYEFLVDFFDKSISFKILDIIFEFNSEIKSIVKIAKSSNYLDEDILNHPFLISTEFFDEFLNPINSNILEIFDLKKSIKYKISKENNDVDYKVKEYIYEVKNLIQ